jgi:hypothetical protein
MSPDDVLAAITDDRGAGRDSALVSLADAATEYLDAHAEYRRVGESDTGASDDELMRIIGRVSRSEAELSRAVGYTQTSPTEEPDAQANQRIADAIGRLDDNDGDPEWMKKVLEKIDRREREKNRWWRRLCRWLRGE